MAPSSSYVARPTQIELRELCAPQSLAARYGVWLARVACATGIGTLGRPRAPDLGCLTGSINGSRVATHSIPPTAWTPFGMSDRGLHHDNPTTAWAVRSPQN